MNVGNKSLYFAYDASGLPMSVTYDSNITDTTDGITYYYITNIQGDVIGIADSAGTQVVSYIYDAWGNILDTDGSLEETLGTINPLRYRGYVYDQETELYYLQSRYYDPEVGRFINADDASMLGANGDFASLNLFVYCGNNPIWRQDPTGELWGAIIGGAIAGAIIGAVSNVVSSKLNGDEITVGGVFRAALTGAVTGAIGAVGGVVEGAKAVCSVAVGIISGVVTAQTTEGTTKEKIAAGVTSGVVAGIGTYMGTKIPTLKDSGVIVEGITAYAGTLFSGTQTEIVNTTAQRAVQFLSKRF